MSNQFNVPLDMLQSALEALGEDTGGAEFIHIKVIAHGLNDDDRAVVLIRDYTNVNDKDELVNNIGHVTSLLEIEAKSRGLE